MTDIIARTVRMVPEERLVKDLDLKDLFDFQHLVPEEKVEDQALRLLGTMDEKTKELAIRILHTLAS